MAEQSNIVVFNDTPEFYGNLIKEKGCVRETIPCITRS